jgi:methylated-DNA-[protein]-cysteine S-methyltransferase
MVNQKNDSIMSHLSEQVFKVVRKIPCGEFLTYKEVAKLISKPRAWRVVGNILNKNPDCKKIPCHRVIRSDGKIGGYRHGTEKKIALLRKEGIIIDSHGKITSRSPK